jgi:hypothetical protein
MARETRLHFSCGYYNEKNGAGNIRVVEKHGDYEDF